MPNRSDWDALQRSLGVRWSTEKKTKKRVVDQGRMSLSIFNAHTCERAAAGTDARAVATVSSKTVPSHARMTRNSVPESPPDDHLTASTSTPSISSRMSPLLAPDSHASPPGCTAVITTLATGTRRRGQPKLRPLEPPEDAQESPHGIQSGQKQPGCGCCLRGHGRSLHNFPHSSNLPNGDASGAPRQSVSAIRCALAFSIAASVQA